MSVPPLTHFIGGVFEPGQGDALQSSNPGRRGEILTEGSEASSEQVAKAVSAARRAQGEWSKKTGMARAQFLYRWADVITKDSGEIARAIAQEVGKPIDEATGEVARAAFILRYYAGQATAPEGEVIPSQVEGAIQYTIREPLGVVGLITPWNFPLAIPIWKMAPALAFGNTVVLKGSELSPLCSQWIAQTALQALLPEGVVNVLLGRGATVGAALVGEEIDGLSFTGSAHTGRLLAVDSAQRNRKFQAEMGGKNVAIVLQPADVPLAAKLVASGAFRYAGQKCTATSRCLVESNLWDSFVNELKNEMNALSIADPLQPGCAIGPVIRQEVVDQIHAITKNAEIVHQVPVPAGLGGFYLPAVAVEEADPDHELHQKELFAPVLTLTRVKNINEALEYANHSEFGLSSSLFTQNLSYATYYTRKIKAGMVRVNADTTGVDPCAPFGGLRGSSTHSPEQGTAARLFYTDSKTVQINP